VDQEDVIVTSQGQPVAVLFPINAGNLEPTLSTLRSVRALLALEMWARTQATKDAESQARFWKEKLFVVTPKHVQRLAVRKALRHAGFLPDKVFVDTVEKMQGQETDMVVVCYGMWNEEEIGSVASFVYSPNRLNVSITRARKKCVILVSESLLLPSAAVLDDPVASKGFFFLRNLLHYAKTFDVYY